MTYAAGGRLVPVPDVGYTMVMTGLSDPERGPDVPGVGEALRKVAAAGGKVASEKLPVGRMGFTGHFTDTKGNLIGL